MAEEIKFFGFGSGEKRAAIDSLNRYELSKYFINLPATCIFTPDEVRAADPSSFPWPIVVRIPTEQESSSTPILIKNWDDLQNVIDQVRNPDATLNFSLPPQAAEQSIYRYMYAYVSESFAYIHDVEKNMGIMLSLNNEKLFGKANAKNSIIRLVRGELGWYVDSIFGKNDSRFNALENCTIGFAVSSYDQFQSGYRAGFFGTNYLEALPKYFSNNSLVGDPYTFGFRVGCRLRQDIAGSVTEINSGTIDKNLIVKLKLTLSPQEFESRMGMVKLHNKIQAGDSTNLCSELLSYLNPGCQNPEFCGYEGQYCSDHCVTLSNIGKNLAITMDNSAKFLQEADSCKNDQYPEGGINIPDVAGKISTIFRWVADNTKFRIVNSSNYNMLVRFQSKNSELQNDIDVDGDLIKTIAFKDNGSLEMDINLDSNGCNMTDDKFRELVSKVNNMEYNLPSNFSGSGAKYSPLYFKSGVGFCLEDDTVLIPQDRFFSSLKSHKGNIFNLYNGV